MIRAVHNNVTEAANTLCGFNLVILVLIFSFKLIRRTSNKPLYPWKVIRLKIWLKKSDWKVWLLESYSKERKTQWRASFFIIAILARSVQQARWACSDLLILFSANRPNCRWITVELSVSLLFAQHCRAEFHTAVRTKKNQLKLCSLTLHERFLEFVFCVQRLLSARPPIQNT